MVLMLASSQHSGRQFNYNSNISVTLPASVTEPGFVRLENVPQAALAEHSFSSSVFGQFASEKSFLKKLLFLSFKQKENRKE